MKYLRRVQRIKRYCSKEYGLEAQITYFQLTADSLTSKLNSLKSPTTAHFIEMIAISSYEPKNNAIHFDWRLKRLVHFEQADITKLYMYFAALTLSNPFSHLLMF